ncbi:MAG: replication-associated recombination protein A [Sphingomonadales bacterium]
MDLFGEAGKAENAYRPLADRLRPKSLKKVIGQDHLVGKDGPIARMVAENHPAAFVLWGPPGSGKTTIAVLFAKECGLEFMQVSATSSGVADLRKIFDAATKYRQAGKQVLLFVDEIHRFNRSQQDSFLPYVENGTIILVGATTENPSFELNAALMSRLTVFVLNRLDEKALETLLVRAEKDLKKKLPLKPEARIALKAMADGDGRYVLNSAETLLTMKDQSKKDAKALAGTLQRRVPVYDKDKEGHYNLISALHKSLRGSDVDGALYWLARMLEGGEDPLYITRRLVRFASEDIGLADPNALLQALAAKDTYQFIGSPEGEIAIVQAVIYLATAPKSNAAYEAEKASRKAAKETGSLMPPKHILNAPTQLMKDIGYGKGYAYDHNTEKGFSGQNYFPDEMKRQTFYQPAQRGFERDIQKRLDYWAKIRAKASQSVLDN